MKYESQKTKEEALAVIDGLKALYPDATCALESGGDPFRLLCMALLSAQCTDKRVNIVSRELFAAYPDVFAMANADISGIEDKIRSCGLYKTKAKHLKELSVMLAEKGGEVPCEMEELLALPGVGRKIANLVRGDIFGLPAVVTDTHCIRICGRLGFYPETLKDPPKVEKILLSILPPEEQSDFCHRIVQFGRDRCKAPNPKCEGCELRTLCNKGKETANG